MSRQRKSVPRIKAALITLGVLVAVAGGVFAGMWWEAGKKRVCACMCHISVPGILN